MSDLNSTDRQYLLEKQYRTGSNLTSRLNLHERYSTNPYGWHRWLFDQYQIAPDARILELGCGTGTLWQVNRDRIPSGWNITLSDFSPGMMQAAKAQDSWLDARCSWEVIDAQAISYDDACFDVVIANHMFYHVPNRDKALMEIHRVLCPDGQLYASTNGRDHLKEIDDLLEVWVPDLERDRTAEQFGLETGAKQLARHFSSVEISFYPDTLEVTEVEPLLEYLQSMNASYSIDERQLDGIRDKVASQIEQQGSFNITKSAGCFRCKT